MRSSLTFRDGLKGGLPIALAYLSVSFGFGIQAAQAALSPLTAALISLTNVTSAGQLAGLTIIAAGGSLMELMLAEFVINIRYALMSVSLTQKLDDSFTTLPRLICSFSMTDELYAVLRRLNREHGVTIAMVSHDLRGAMRDANKVLVMNHGVDFCGSVEEYRAMSAERREG